MLGNVNFIMADFRYTADLPDKQLINVPNTDAASKSAEGEKPQIPKKVGLILQKTVMIIYLTFMCWYS